MAVHETGIGYESVRFEHVRYDYPPPPSHEWTKKEMDDELRENGIKIDYVNLKGHPVLKLIGFEMELSAKVSRARFVVGEESADANGQMVRGVADYIAEDIGTASGSMASESGGVVGVELNWTYLQPAYVGQQVTVIAKPLTICRSVHVWEIKFGTERMNGSKREWDLIAVARLTLMEQKSKPMEKFDALSKL